MAIKKKKAAKKVVKKAAKKVVKKKVTKKVVKKKAAKKVVKKKVVAKKSSGRVKKGMKAIRYTSSKKNQILAFIKQVNKKNGKGGIAAAVRKYKVSAITINRWKK